MEREQQCRVCALFCSLLAALCTPLARSRRLSLSLSFGRSSVGSARLSSTRRASAVQCGRPADWLAAASSRWLKLRQRLRSAHNETLAGRLAGSVQSGRVSSPIGEQRGPRATHRQGRRPGLRWCAPRPPLPPTRRTRGRPAGRLAQQRAERRVGGRRCVGGPPRPGSARGGGRHSALSPAADVASLRSLAPS